MALEVADLIAKLRLDQTDFEKKLKSAETSFSGMTSKITGLASTMGIGVSLSFGTVAAAAIKAALDIDNAFDRIRIGTGATGAALKGLQQDFTALFRSLPSTANDVSRAVADLNTRLGLTGEPLRQLATQVLNLARITESDLTSVIRGATRVFGDWGISTMQQGQSLDFLFKASQATGIEVSRLMDMIVQYGAPMRQFNFSFEEAATMLGKWEKEGVNTELVLGSLRIAIGEFARANIPLRQGLEETIRKILALGPGAQATAAAMKTFGARAGADMAAAILEGRLSIEDLLVTLQKSSETINKAAKDTEDFAEAWQRTKNRVTLILEPLGTQVLRLAEIMLNLNDVIVDSRPWQTMDRWMNALIEPVTRLGQAWIEAAASVLSYLGLADRAATDAAERKALSDLGVGNTLPGMPSVDENLKQYMAILNAKKAGATGAGAPAVDPEEIKKANDAIRKMIESVTEQRIELEQGEIAALKYSLAHGEMAKASPKAKAELIALTQALITLKMQQEIEATTQADAVEELTKTNTAIKEQANLFIVSSSLLSRITKQYVERSTAEEVLAKGIKATSEEYVKLSDRMSDIDRIMQTLQQHRELNFVQRILHPEDFHAIEIAADEFATHLMETAEVAGRFLAYPTVIFDSATQKLRQLGQDAMQYALQTGEFIEFQTQEAADNFAKNYKNVWGEYTISLEGVKRAHDKAILSSADVVNAFGRVGASIVVLSEDIDALYQRYNNAPGNLQDYRLTVRAIEDLTEAQVKLGSLKPEEAIERQRTALLQLRQQIQAHIDLTGNSALTQLQLQAELAQTDRALRQLGNTSKTLKDIFSDVFSGVMDILSLFGVKVGRVILMLQSLPRALSGVEKIAGGIASLIGMIATPASAAAGVMNWTAADGPISNVFKLGNAASEASGDVGVFGSIIGMATRLLGLFTQGLGLFSSKIATLLTRAGVPAGVAGGLGNAIGGGIAGLGITSMFTSNTITRISGALQSTVLNFFLPGLGTILGTANALIAGGIAKLFGGGKMANIGAQLGSLFGPFGSLLGGFLGSLFGSPKAKLMATIEPFDRSNLSNIVDQAGLGTQVGAARVNVGGNIMSGKKEHRLQQQLAEMVNGILISVVDATIQMIDVLPPALATQLDDALSALETTGLEIVDKKWKGGSVKKFKKRVKGLADEVIQDLFEALDFGDIDLKKLGGGKRGDAGKGFDLVMGSLSLLSAIAREAGSAVDLTTVSLADFTKGSVELVQKFATEGEAFADTLRRVAENFQNLFALQSQIDAAVQTLTGDTARALALLQDALQRVNDRAIAAIDALTIDAESGSSPDAVLAAAEAAMQAVTNALEAQIAVATRLRDAVTALNAAIDDALDLFISLEQQIRALGGATYGTALTSQYIIEAFNATTDVATRISLWTRGIQLFIAEGGNVMTVMSTITEGFRVMMDQIRAEVDTKAAIAQLQALAAGITSTLNAAIAAVQARYAAERAALQSATQATIDGLNAQRDAINSSYDAQLDGLRDQREAAQDLHEEQMDGLREQLDVANEWRRVLDSARAQLVDLFNLLAPTHPLTSLNEVRAQFEAARATFALDPTVEGAEQVQALARQLIEIAQLTPGYDLASGNFQALAADIRTALEAVALFAESQPSAEAIQAQIADLEAQQAASLASIDEQIRAVEQARASALASIDQQIVNANASLQSAMADLSAREQAEIVELQRIAALGLEEVRNELGRRLLELQVQQQTAADALREVIGDKSYEQYIAERQAEAVQRLDAINQTLRDYLGSILSNLFPGATVPSHAGGLDYVPYDNYRANLHREEMVLKPSEARAYRQGRGGETSVVLNFAPGAVAVTMTGRESESEMERKIDKALAAVLRRGMGESRSEILHIAKQAKR